MSTRLTYTSGALAGETDDEFEQSSRRRAPIRASRSRI